MRVPIRSLVSLFALTSGIGTASADELHDAIASDMPSLMEVYRDLHAHPELSFQETRSAAKLAKEARSLGFKVTEGVGKTGVVAVMENGDGPVVMIRADMDGLPVVEQTGLTYASKERGVSTAGVESGIMHACGHDTHMTGWLATARQLAARKDQWSGTLVMILQPAEEIGLGAQAMLDDGLYSRFPKPDYVLAFHDSASAPAGTVAYTPGYALANVDSVDIEVKGIGGHGAYPQSTIDPIVIASAIVTRLQTIVSREIAPQDPAVVTVGSFHAGAKHNIIPDSAHLQLTVRSYSDEVRQKLLDSIKRIAVGEGRVAGLPEDKLPVVSTQDHYTPSTYNDPELTEQIATMLKGRFGEQRVVKGDAAMGGEDFSQFRRADPDDVESLIFWVGGVPMDQWEKAQSGEMTLPSLHSPFWAPEADAVIATGAEALTSAALSLMPKA